MPYLVNNLIEGRPLPVTVRRDDCVTVALKLMAEKEFSQLPVVDSGNHPLGMVNYESILRGMRHFRAKIDELHVRDAIISVDRFYLDDGLFELLERLKVSNAVLIVNPDETLVGIVTSYDSTEYFRKRAENLMRVEDIELMLKEFILLAYTGSDGVRTETELTEAITKVSSESGNSKVKTFEELTLGQYISLLVAKNTWSFFDPIFKISRDSIRLLLDDIRETRNGLAHFRTEITTEQTDQLRFFAKWLEGCRDDYEKTAAQKDYLELFQPLSKKEELPNVVIREENSNYKITKDEINLPTVEKPGQIQVIAEETRLKDSRYAPLADFLLSQPGKIDQVRLTFDEIEAMIGGSLPASAYQHRAWWANDTQGHPHAQMWLESGWRTTYINQTEKTVTFTRIREREKAYIDFFSLLLEQLRKQAEFPLRQVSPDGTNWVVCQTVSTPGYIAGEFNYSFARGKQFRIEFYIDTYDQASTKKIFDLIYNQKAEIEARLGGLSWERINDKRASRIALYHAGDINDTPETLAKLRDWAVVNMNAFYQTLRPIAEKAFMDGL